MRVLGMERGKGMEAKGCVGIGRGKGMQVEGHVSMGRQGGTVGGDACVGGGARRDGQKGQGPAQNNSLWHPYTGIVTGPSVPSLSQLYNRH
jgi:hypothetical protein